MKQRYEVTRNITARYTYHLEAESKDDAERIARELGEVYADEMSYVRESITVRRDASGEINVIERMAASASATASEPS